MIESITSTHPDDPAMPFHGAETQTDFHGLSAREYAAITLRVADSGTPWLDSMIQRARKYDIAKEAASSYIAGAEMGAPDAAANVVQMLNAMLDQLFPATEQADAGDPPDE